MAASACATCARQLCTLDFLPLCNMSNMRAVSCLMSHVCLVFSVECVVLPMVLPFLCLVCGQTQGQAPNRVRLGLHTVQTGEVVSTAHSVLYRPLFRYFILVWYSFATPTGSWQRNGQRKSQPDRNGMRGGNNRKGAARGQRRCSKNGWSSCWRHRKPRKVVGEGPRTKGLDLESNPPSH